MKPDIVFFGENLPEMFHRAMKQDKDEVDLLIVIGSSLKVRPVALIPSMFIDTRAFTSDCYYVPAVNSEILVQSSFSLYPIQTPFLMKCLRSW